MLYQPEEDPTVVKIKSVQCFLCLVVSILNCETQKKHKHHTSNKKINSNDLDNKLFFKKCLRHKNFST